MEPSENEQQDEDHGLFIEEHLSSLKTSAKVAEDSVVAALNRLKVVQQKVKLNVEEMSQTELRSKPALRKWLQARNLSNQSSFQEFFQIFLDEHQKDYRLDISERSICLNREACQLLGIEGKDQKITMVQFLEKLPLLYH